MNKKILGVAVLAGMTGMFLSCEGPAGPKGDPGGGGTSSGPLSPQMLDYTENPVDIPNPDRGFYRANDGLVVPVTGTEPGIVNTINVGATPVVIGGEGSTVSADTRVSHMYFDLRRFSDNAFLEQHNPRYNAAGVGNTMTIEEWETTVVPNTPKGKSRELTQPALDYIKRILQQVRDGNGVGLVRFNYDGRGFSWVDYDSPVSGYVDKCIQDIEPDKETVLQHISQLKPIFHEYEDVIMAVDGGFFGPWGEMHSTSFGTSPEAYAWLLDALLDAVPAPRTIIVHAGAFLSWYNNRYGKSYSFADIDTMPVPQPGSPEARFGFFNDSYAYGADEGDEDYPDDWGSLSEGSGWLETGTDDDYDRGKLMTWIRKQNSLYGGEAQGDATPWNSFPFVAWEASYAQTVYLNADYEDAVHERWLNFIYNEAGVTTPMTNSYSEPGKTAVFDPVYNDKTGLEFWRDRLGYRLVLREAKMSEWVEQNGTLKFEGKIQNVGFGNIVNRKNVWVVLKPQAASNPYVAMALTNLDARNWRPDLDGSASNTAAYRDLNFSVRMSAFGSVPLGDYDVYLKINDPKERTINKRCIRFANKGNIWDSELGANLIGSITVK